MKTTETKATKKPTTIPAAENKKGIENHKKAATHYEAAAKSHLEAAKHHENENHEKAAKSTLEAHEHAKLAIEAQKIDANQHGDEF